MAERARPPDDISPLDFFTRWVPDRVAADAERRERLGETRASLVFVLTDVQAEVGEYTLHITSGYVRGEVGRVAEPDLEVRVDCETWRRLNRGELSAPEAVLRRRLSLTGDVVLALKLHVILS